MKYLHALIAGAGVGLCLVAIAKGDDDQISNFQNSTRTIVIRRVTIVRGNTGRVIYVNPAYKVKVVGPMSGRAYPSRVTEGYQSVMRAQYGHTTWFKAIPPSHNSDVNQPEQKGDSGRAEKVAKSQQPTDPDALDRFSAQAQEEEQNPIAGPDGIAGK